jgi:CheY-like chemotaxis protein
MDDSPCVLDLHRNNDIIFVELALGLNREKLALLRYKLSELIEKENIEAPKIVIMLTNLELSFVDGYNLEFLIDNILSCPRIKNTRVKILSLSPYMKDFIDGHPNYEGIELSTNLPRVLSSLVETAGSSSVSDLITDKILTQTKSNEDSVDTRFSSDSASYVSGAKKTGTVLKIAIIDDNLDSLEETKNSFIEIGADCIPYTSGQDFLNSYHDENFNLVIHDVLLKDQTGLNVLRALQTDPESPPVLVYSPSLQKDFVIKVLSSGAKSFLVKPQKPQVLVQKALSLLGN